MAERITAYLAGVQERVQAAERERAVAVARAIEERRRRKVQLALAASVLAFTTLGGLSTTYYLQQRAERARQRIEQAAAIDRVVGQADTLREQASANPEDLPRWQVALAAVKQAEAAGDEAAAPRLLALRTEIQAGLDAAQRDKTLLDRLVDIRSAEADDPDGSITDARLRRRLPRGRDRSGEPDSRPRRGRRSRLARRRWRWPWPRRWTTGRRIRRDEAATTRPERRD